MARMTGISAVVAVGVLLCGLAEAKVERPDKAIEPASCVTAECHVSVKAYKLLHAPVNVNACDACHQVDDAKKHTFTHVRKDAQLCTFCHEFNVGGVPVVHAPVAKGQCLGCHNPHGGMDKRFTRENTVKGMCGSCHEDVARGMKHLHTPVTEGKCDSCHTSHASRFPKLLYAEGDALCHTCHREFQDQVAAVRFPHQAMKDGCSKCHLPHGSAYAKHIKQPIVELCSSACHEDVRKAMTLTKFKHGGMNQERSCVNCHMPHGSDLATSMRDTPLKLCMECHGDKVKTDRGYVVAGLPELKDPKTNKHGPINDGRCGACHEVHGSNQTKLLVLSNQKGFYQEMVADSYRLCFNCHDMALAAAKQTVGATDFRNGTDNLHFIHVNEKRGHNCNVCHASHASTVARHVNESVQFGKWRLPIAFKATETGGTCTPGCHAEYPYDRVRPVPPPTTRPTRPWPPEKVAGGTAAPSDPAAPLKWGLTSVDGSELKVPHPGQPTILVFSRPKNTEQPYLLQLLRAVADPTRAQVVLVVSGDDAFQEARKLSDARIVPGHIVVDTKEELRERLQVNVWPTTLVIRSDGTQAARISGAPDNLAHSLIAYLDFASGKIDRLTLTQRLATRLAVGDTPARKAARELQSFQRMIEAGKAAQAREALEKAIAEQPEATSLQVAMIKLLTAEGQATEAIQAIDRLKADALPPGETEVLRARAHMQMKQWNAAAKVLTQAINKSPKLGEAHYLLAQLYEKSGDFQKAALHYRAALDIK